MPAPSLMNSLIDTHCHLDYIVRTHLSLTDATDGNLPTDRKSGDVPWDGEVSLVETPEDTLKSVSQIYMARAKALNVGAVINPGVVPEKFADVVRLTEVTENLYAALAIHPTDVDVTLTHPSWLEDLNGYASHPKVVAIGETGLDYYHRPPENDAEHIARQQQCFRTLIELALKHKLPVIIHDREAHTDIAQIVADYQPQGLKGVMHCFSGDGEFAQQMIELGMMISFAGNITFKKAEDLREAAKVIPLEHILVETDAPFLSPMPHRGLYNEPARTHYAAACIASVKDIPLETVTQVTTENAMRLFHKIQRG